MLGKQDPASGAFRNAQALAKAGAAEALLQVLKNVTAEMVDDKETHGLVTSLCTTLKTVSNRAKHIIPT